MKKNVKLLNLFKGIIISFIISIICIIITSIILRFTNIQESKLTLINNITMTLSICLGSMYLAIKSKENGWLHGSILGGIYYIIILVLKVIFINENIFKSTYLLRLIVSVILGAIGGIIGINLI